VGALLTSSLFLALNLQTGIIPDEPAHFIFSKHFASTWGIPPDTPKTYSWGIYIEQNPFLYHWINGRIINAVNLFEPAASDWQLLVTLRLLNVLFSLGTVLFCFMLSRELIKDPWWQLVPIFLLTNTLMFVFLSGGVNYDNLANLFSSAGLLFFVRVFTRNNFIKNSLAWIIMIGLGTLVKFTILPLGLAMSLVWLLFLNKFRRNIFPIELWNHGEIVLTCLTLVILAGNFAIYGINLIRYQTLTPPCREILSEEQCETSIFERRAREIARPSKISIEESIAQGYPSPIKYAAVDWVYNMLMRSFGMIGHKSYFPIQIISLYQILFYGMLLLGLINLFYRRRVSLVNLSLLWIIIFYASVLLIKNYSSELLHNFTHIGFQGRYIFPVITIIYVLYAKVIKSTPIWVPRMFILVVTIIVFFYGGPITLLKGYNSFLTDWFR
jgi:hypothetical protein